jgi:hypothetical protein
MALPASGPISMNDIRVELGFPSQSPFSLYTAETGGYVLLNQCSTFRPNGSTPDRIAEWYSYNHTQQCPPIACSVSQNNGSGGKGLYNFSITLGSGTGTVYFRYDAQTVPDKFEVIFDGVTVIDTGFVGDCWPSCSSYNSQLNALGYPNVSGPNGTTSFSKTTGTTTATVRITAPLTGTAWSFILGCPAFSQCVGYSAVDCANACADIINCT